MSQDFFSRLWIVLMCLFRFEFERDLLQKGHWVVWLSCTCLTCLARLLIANSFSQCGQGFLILSCCSLMCRPRLSTLISFWHSLHFDFSPTRWALWMWLFNNFLPWKVESQWGHSIFLPEWELLICLSKSSHVSLQIWQAEPSFKWTCPMCTFRASLVMNFFSQMLHSEILSWQCSLRMCHRRFTTGKVLSHSWHATLSSKSLSLSFLSLFASEVVIFCDGNRSEKEKLIDDDVRTIH